jgi:hypothetical protein
MSRSTPPHPLPENGKLEGTREKTYQVRPEKEKHTDVESNEPSVVASSIANGVEKLHIPEGDGPSTAEKGVEEPQNAVEYPKGLEMFFIMLALVLSITLCSLDQVSPTAPSLFCQWITRQYANLNSDHCCNRYSKYYRPIRQTSGYLMVRFSLFPDARRIPVTIR